MEDLFEVSISSFVSVNEPAFVCLQARHCLLLCIGPVQLSFYISIQQRKESILYMRWIHKLKRLSRPKLTNMHCADNIRIVSFIPLLHCSSRPRHNIIIQTRLECWTVEDEKVKPVWHRFASHVLSAHTSHSTAHALATNVKQ